MKKNKISVIVPIYNVENYLRRCIDSILKSTYENLEIILVDDGSTDECPTICDDYAKKDPRIKVIHKKNGGLSDARNKGLDIATGEYISFIDSDDCINKNMLSYLMNLLVDNSCDISVCDFYTFSDVCPTVELSQNADKNFKIFSNKEAIALLLYGEKSHGDYAWNKLYKKKLFNNVRYPIKRKMEDIGTTYKLYYESKKIVISNEKLYYYYQRNDSILGKKGFQIFSDNFELSFERYNFLKKKNILNEKEIVIYHKDVLNKIIDVYKNANAILEKDYFNQKNCRAIYTEIFKKYYIDIMKSSSIKLKIKYLVYNFIFRRNI